ncbi:mCG1036785, isoform CRA_a [Mus musculus]|nr:mCG1036785, isoform CRA_a [Mus musculus]
MMPTVKTSVLILFTGMNLQKQRETAGIPQEVLCRVSLYDVKSSKD